MPKRPREDSELTALEATSSTSVVPSVDEPHHPSKYLQQTLIQAPTGVTLKCSLPPHHEPLDFPTIEEFETHYAKIHAHRCLECRKNFPTDHFLDLHINENHNPLREVRVARGEKTVGPKIFNLEHTVSKTQDP